MQSQYPWDLARLNDRTINPAAISPRRAHAPVASAEELAECAKRALCSQRRPPPCELTAIRTGRERNQRSVTDQFIPVVRPRQALPRAPAYCTSGDVRNRMIGQWQAGIPGPTRGTGRRTSLGGERRPQSEVIEDAPDDSRILDQSDDPHRPLALGALQRVGLIDLADQPRPGGPCARSSTARGKPSARRFPGTRGGATKRPFGRNTPSAASTCRCGLKLTRSPKVRTRCLSHPAAPAPAVCRRQRGTGPGRARCSCSGSKRCRFSPSAPIARGAPGACSLLSSPS